MQSDKPKAASTTQPTRRQEPVPVRFNEASDSARKKPNGTKTAMFEILSAGPCPVFRNRRERSSVRLQPEVWGVIPNTGSRPPHPEQTGP